MTVRVSPTRAVLTTPSPGLRMWRRLRRNPSAVFAGLSLILVTSFACLGPLLYRIDPNSIDFAQQFAHPSAAHPFGTDENGRDVMVRLMLGGRVSLAVGVFAVLLSVTLGTLLGALAGYYRGVAGALLMRITDGMLAIPSFFVTVMALTFFGAGITQLVAVIGLTSWMGLSRLTYGEVLKYREEIAVEAARALGAGDARILWQHVLPQVFPTILVNASLGVSFAILTESALSFLGLGVQPPAASWGNMLSNAQNYLYAAPLLAVYPGALILLTVLGFNLLGDAVRDATDPAG